jgi:poly-gamma-glutamate synthesis protein (capsule biosynthesis protein)
MDRVVHGAVRPFAIAAALILGVGLLAIGLLPVSQRSVTIAFAGDIMLGRGVAQAHQQCCWDRALAALAPCTVSVDLAFANLESPLTSAPLNRETYDLRAPFEAHLALAAAGLDLVSLANNHITDSGEQGVHDTLAALRAAGVVGLGPSDLPWTTTLGGLKLAFLAFEDVLEPVDLRRAQAALKAQRRHADLLIVSVHWGNELESLPNARQQILARGLAAAGADIIIGHHPHVLQPVEWLWGEGRGRPTLVAYSLGNALFDQAAPPATRQGALLLVQAGPTGAVHLCVFPFQLDPRTWDVIPASPEAAARIAQDLGISCLLPSPCSLELSR